MNKNQVVQARLTDAQARRLQELCELTGFSSSQVLRLLIERSEVRMYPSVGATLAPDAQETG